MSETTEELIDEKQQELQLSETEVNAVKSLFCAHTEHGYEEKLLK